MGVFLKVRLNVGSGHTEPFHLSDSNASWRACLPSAASTILPILRKTLSAMYPPFPQLPPKHKALPGSPEWTEPSSRPIWTSLRGSGPCHPGARVESWAQPPGSSVMTSRFRAGIEMAGQAQVRGGLLLVSWPLPLASGGCQPLRLSGYIGAGKLWTAHGYIIFAAQESFMSLQEWHSQRCWQLVLCEIKMTDNFSHDLPINWSSYTVWKEGRGEKEESPASYTSNVIWYY